MHNFHFTYRIAQSTMILIAMITQAPTPARTSKEQFDRQASHYDEQWNQWSKESITWMLEHAACKPTDRVLDVATGTGFCAQAFAPHVASVVGLDVSVGMLETGRQRMQAAGVTNVAFQEGAAEAIPCEDGSFDLVTARVAPHHFLDIRRFAHEVHRVLKPGGRFILADTTVPDGDAAADAWQNEIEVVRDPSHVRNYNATEWRSIVEEAGLKVTDLTSGGGGITVPVSDWIKKAGCGPEQVERIQQLLRTAPASAVAQFNIHESDGETYVTWHRIALVAEKAS